MKIHLGGCFETFSTQIQENVAVLGGVGIGIGFMQVLVFLAIP